jgi:hypothetical protein
VDELHTITLLYVFKTHFVKKKIRGNTWRRKADLGNTSRLVMALQQTNADK